MAVADASSHGGCTSHDIQPPAPEAIPIPPWTRVRLTPAAAVVAERVASRLTPAAAVVAQRVETLTVGGAHRLAPRDVQ